MFPARSLTPSTKSVCTVFGANSPPSVSVTIRLASDIVLAVTGNGSPDTITLMPPALAGLIGSSKAIRTRALSGTVVCPLAGVAVTTCGGVVSGADEVVKIREIPPPKLPARSATLPSPTKC